VLARTKRLRNTYGVEVWLDGLRTVGASVELPPLLAFGCWIIVGWQMSIPIGGGG